MDNDHPGQDAASGAEAVCEGMVTQVRNGTVVVEMADAAGCESCAGKAVCQPLTGGARCIELPGSGFSVGDHVRIITSSRFILYASVVLYLIPALLVVTGAFAGFAVGNVYLGIDGDLGSLGGVALGIVLSLVFVHFYKVGLGAKPIVRLERID